MKIALVMSVLVILSIDMFFFLGQTAIDNIGEGGTEFHSYEGSFLQDYDTGNFTIPTGAELPSGSASVSPTTGNVFTDMFTSIKETLLDIPVLGTVLRVATALPSYLSSTTMPDEAKFALSSFWYGIHGLIIVAFIWGRE